MHYTGNEEAGSLARKGTESTQMYNGFSFKSNTLINSKYKGKWGERYNKEDGYYQLNREQQVTIFQLSTDTID
jgi:hypothetical protein